MTDTATAGALWTRALAQVREEQAKRAVDAERQRVATDAEAIRDRCRTLTGFIREAWHVLEPATDYVPGWHIDAIAEHMEAVSRGDIQNLAVHVPPGSMKTLMIGVFWPAHEWGPLGMPHKSTMSGSYEADLALTANRKLRRLVTSEWFQALWPLPLIKAGDEQFENAKGGFSWARAFASMTGGRANRVRLDDPHSTDKAESPKERGRAVRLFRESVTDRLNDPKVDSLIVMMQRLHANDVGGCIEELGLNFTRLVIPMEFEPARRCTTGIGWRDPRTYEGELMCPERWPSEVIDRLKKGKGAYAWSGQYQQRPVPWEGGMFKREWFADKFVDAAPQGVVWVRHWDLAATKRSAIETTGARTAGVKMGRAPDGSIIVADLKTAAEEGHRVRQLIKTVAETDGMGVEISLPQDPGQAGKAQASDYIAMLAGWNVHARPETGDKETRAEPFAAQCEGGNVYLVRGPWNSDFVDEVALFPGGPRKDVVDACSGAFGRLIKPIERNMEFAAPKFFTG